MTAVLGGGGSSGNGGRGGACFVIQPLALSLFVFHPPPPPPYFSPRASPCDRAALAPACCVCVCVGWLTPIPEVWTYVRLEFVCSGAYLFDNTI